MTDTINHDMINQFAQDSPDSSAIAMLESHVFSAFGKQGIYLIEIH